MNLEKENKPWAPILEFINSPDKKYSVMMVKEWQGGEGVCPKAGQFVGPDGLVDSFIAAVRFPRTEILCCPIYYDRKHGQERSFSHHRNWLSIAHKDDCLFSRRLGISGKIIFGHSIRLRLFGKDII